MLDRDQATNYLSDLAPLILEAAQDARQRRDEAVGTDDYDVRVGELIAYNRIVSLLIAQAEAFDIDRSSIGLADVDPDRDLL